MIDFIGIGAQKSGTSWTYACLYEHPEICAPIKEIHFFSRPRFQKGQLWYESHFQKCAEGKKKGEFSTSYLYSEDAPQRIFDLYPKVKLIAIVRNPVARSVSQYRNSIKSGEITQSVFFDAYMQSEKSVLEQGLYFTQLKRYTELFSDEQMLVLVYEDIQKDPVGFMRKIYTFLGVDDSFESSMLHTEVNIARTPKRVIVDRVMHHVAESLRKIGFDKLVHWIRKSGVPDFVRSHNTKKDVQTVFNEQKLKEYFAGDVKNLSILLGRDLTTEWGIDYET